MSQVFFVRVKAGAHDRRDAPVTVEIDESVPIAGLAPEAKGRPGRKGEHIIPAQRDGRAVTFVLPRLKPGREIVLTPVAEVPRWLVKKSQAALEEGEGGEGGNKALAITIGSKPFAEYRHGPEAAKPFLWPLAGPGETRMTRSWPMEEKKGDSDDHVHHKGLWVAHGDVNGSDLWGEGRKCGRIVHRELTKKISGPVYAEFASTNVWQSRRGKPLCEEDRTIRAMRLGDDARLVDLTVRLRATEGDLTFGDTKEGGICAVRVACSMERAGRIENSYGAVGEPECWGRASHWVDYSGRAGGRHRGVAILDHPCNLRHPTRWHVRGYGLFAANPFALGAYKKGLDRDGSYTVPAGGELLFRY
ncbi:MAG: DUF6807 domain-containing protein, partial [Planctomycetota bacterium]